MDVRALNSVRNQQANAKETAAEAWRIPAATNTTVQVFMKVVKRKKLFFITMLGKPIVFYMK